MEENAIIDELDKLTEILYSETYSRKGDGEEARGLLKKLSGDPRIKKSLLFEVDALIRHLDLEQSDQSEEGNLSEPLTWVELEEQLIDEFPDVAYPYEALLKAAEHANERPLADGVAQDLVDHPFAPTWIKDRAQLLLARNDVIGLSMAYMLDAEWPEAAKETSGSVVLLYTWSSKESERLKLFGKWLRDYPDPTVVFLGVCLDLDSPEVRKAAKQLPGSQLIYKEGEVQSVLTRLHADMGFLVYRSDSFGIIQSVEFKHSFSSQP
ncbi:hypothetical protein [Pelagicoccus sp. SDUM812003]|uniref:hypothetical protein n=1 Tax=Pelagicoccus sp. SDUM812003 TaxID=3041267 RepID=UPI002811E1EA|nr:hypothetical protein [Pelagicoccus sp. SDUM812003]